ncbi:MAG: hypothetical protein ACSLEM_05770 [Candidatus Malihini olakiniferum]
MTDSHHLIESKSFKLYLNSFNQTVFENWQLVQETLTRDLAACAQGNVSVVLFSLDTFKGQTSCQFQGECIDGVDVHITDYFLSMLTILLLLTMSRALLLKKHW